MATIRVLPLPDSVDQRGSWQVKRGNRRISTHIKKSAAVSKARSEAGPNDHVEIRRTDGTVQ